MGEGNELRFRRFHKRLGKPGFAPDFLDSLARIAADTGPRLDERVLALAKLRAWGNYSEYAIRIESDGTEQTLTQQDFAWDLAWLESGIRWEWLDAPKSVRTAETTRLNIKPIDKTALSKAIRRNEMRGTISPVSGRRIVPTVSPDRVASSSEDKLDRSQEFQEFLVTFQLEHSAEFEELELARSTVKRLRRVVLSHYKQWRASKRNSGPSYKPLETPEGKQAAVSESAAADLSACLPAEAEPSNGPEPAPRLAAIRSVFPNEYIPSTSLDVLDRHLAAALRTEYDPKSFVAFVAARRRKGRISAGLVFDVAKGLPGDFVHKVREELTSRCAAVLANAREKRQMEQDLAEHDKERARRVLTDPFSTADAIADARTVEPHWQPSTAAQQEAFEQRVRNALDALGRPCSSDYRAECITLLARAAEIDSARLGEIKNIMKPVRAKSAP